MTSKNDLPEQQHILDTLLSELNSNFGGECLGSEVTKEQRESILTKSYKGLHIGDYWEKNGIKWRIGEFGRKTPDDKDSLITIVPDETLFNIRLSTNEANKMFTLLYMIFSELIVDFDFTTDLMNERMVFGKSFYGDDKLNCHEFDNEKQLALFNLNQEYIKSDDSYWLKDAVSITYFAYVDGGGNAYCLNAGDVGGVRPALFIHGRENNKKHTPDTSLSELNSIFRGECLGTEVTKEQRESILNKSYDGLHVGDYWEKDGIKWRIGEFGRKTPDGKDSLITIVPDETLFITRLTNNNTNRMFKLARNMFSELFDDFDFTTNLMNERMVFGKKVYGDDTLNYHAFNNERQLALFNLNQECIKSNDSYWLNDVVVSATAFAVVNDFGRATFYGAGCACGVRPAFFIHDQENNKKHDESKSGGNSMTSEQVIKNDLTDTKVNYDTWEHRSSFVDKLMMLLPQYRYISSFKKDGKMELGFYDGCNTLKVEIDEGDYIVKTNCVSGFQVIKNDLTEQQHIPNISLSELNSIFGGNCLGTEITKEQREVILNKSYKGLHIGDYWEKDGNRWRIGEFGRKTPDGKDSLITIVPDETLFNMRLTNNEVNKMFKLSRVIFSELFDDFVFTTDLMNERMVFGKREWGDDELNHHAFDNEKQLLLFKIKPEYIKSDGSYWLNDVAVSAPYFAIVGNHGDADYAGAGHVLGVRPAFFIHGRENNKKHD